ncbi:MAG: acyltransferase family protein, partial [Planctomycetaceae bacterium]
ACYAWGTTYDPTATFYLLPTRAWELACGCALAIFTRRRGENVVQRQGLLLLGFAAVMTSYFFFEGHGRQNGALLIPVLGSVLMIYHGGKGSGAIDSLLCHPVTVYIGKISYALYLWHWPILCLHRTGFIQEQYGLNVVAMVPLIIVCAMASYHLIEVPVRRQKRAIVPICLALAGSVAFSAYLYREDHSYETAMYSETVWKGRVYDVTPTQVWHEAARQKMQGIVVPPRAEAESQAFANGGIIKKYGGDTPDVVVLGDSHALMWAGVIDEICGELGVTVSFCAADGMTPFVDLPIQKEPPVNGFTSDEKYIFENVKLEKLEKWKPKIVVIAVRWGSVRNLPTDVLEFMGSIGSRVLLIEQPPRLYFGNRNAPQYLSYLRLHPVGSTRQYIPAADKRVKMQVKRVVNAIIKQFPFSEAAEIASIYENDRGEAWVLDGSDVLYIDDDHLSEKGSLKAKGMIKDKFVKMLE